MSTHCVRIQRKNGQVVTGCDVYIGRACYRGGWQLDGSIWQNPYSVNTYGRDEALRRFREYIISRKELMDRLEELKGKTLGCWCMGSDKGEPCHGEILIELLNEREKKNQH